MKKDRTGKAYEDLTTIVFRHLTNNLEGVIVEKNVRLNGIDGKRQIDVLVTAQIGPIKVQIVIECKDYKRDLTYQG